MNGTKSPFCADEPLAKVFSQCSSCQSGEIKDLFVLQRLSVAIQRLNSFAGNDLRQSSSNFLSKF